MQGGVYHSRDLGFLCEGELYVLGRTDDLIIVHGKNIYAHDVEFAVNQVPGVKPGRVVAIGTFVPDVGTHELLLIVESTEPADRHAALSRAIKSAVVQLTALAPRAVRIVEPGWLVKTTSGKISRTENLHKHQVTLFTQLAGVIRDAFHCPDVEITRETSSLDIDGWDSLSHTILLLRVEKDFGVRLPLERTRTIANVGDLADLLEPLVSLVP